MLSKLFYFIFFYFVLVVTLALPQRDSNSGGPECLVTENSTGQVKACILPFVHVTKVNYACTNASDIDGKFW